MTRRGLLAAGTATVLAGCAAPGAPAPTRGRPAFLAEPGVQLWTVNAELQRDFERTLRSVAALGYRRVETAGLHGRTPAQFRAALDAAGLSCDSIHVSIGDLESDLEARMDEAVQLGARWVVASAPVPAAPPDPKLDWQVGMGRAMTLADWRRNAELMNRFGGRAAAGDLRFAYHNHAFEFQPVDGVVPWDELLRLTDPGLVKLELDVAWATVGGLDPVAVMRANPGRCELLHLKDVRRTPQGGWTTVEVGAGEVDWPAVFAAAETAGVQAAFVEQEAPFARPVLDSLRTSLAYLRSA